DLRVMSQNPGWQHHHFGSRARLCARSSTRIAWYEWVSTFSTESGLPGSIQLARVPAAAASADEEKVSAPRLTAAGVLARPGTPGSWTAASRCVRAALRATCRVARPAVNRGARLCHQ